MASSSGNTRSSNNVNLNANTFLAPPQLPRSLSAQSHSTTGDSTAGSGTGDADSSSANLTTPLLASQDPGSSTAPPVSTNGAHGNSPGATSAVLQGNSAATGAASSAAPFAASSNNQGTPNAPVPRTSTTRRHGAFKRLGHAAVIVLIAGPLCILVALILLALLWFANHDISSWRYIVANDYLMTAVAGLGKVIETSLAFTVSTSCAMLAAIALEGFHVLLPNAAEVSNARLSGGAVDLFSLSWKQIRAKGPPGIRSWSLLILCVITTLTFFYSQLVTIILNTDIGVSNLGSFSISEQLAYGFTVNLSSGGIPEDYIEPHGINWLKKPTIFPTYAEYSEAPVEQEGVSDTGVSLRAFLPYASQQMRQNVQSYTGGATVVDTRVTCQVPEIVDVTMQLTNEDPDYVWVIGSVSATRATPRLRNQTFTWPLGGLTSEESPIIDEPIAIRCLAPISEAYTTMYSSSPPPPSWRSSLCELPNGGWNHSTYSGGLVSEFQNPDPLNMANISEAQSVWLVGSAFLFLNVTTGSSYNWRAVVGNSTPVTPPSYQDRHEWKDYIFSGGDLILSATLCYSSFMTADLPVEMQSSSNRSEPTASFDFESRNYIFPGVRAQMGSDGSTSLTQRGVLSLEPQRSSWLANSTTELPEVEPWIRNFANMNQYALNSGYGIAGNFTAVLINSTTSSTTIDELLVPDPFYVDFFQDIVRHGGSVGFALQSMYTVMASMSYYDQQPQFDKTDTSARTSFVPVNQPLWWRGLLATTVIVAVHFAASAVILVKFLRSCKYSLLGDTWASVAQVRSPATAQVFDMAPDMRDKEIEEHLKGRAEELTRIGLGVPDGQSEPGIMLAPGTVGGPAPPQMTVRRRRP